MPNILSSLYHYKANVFDILTADLEQKQLTHWENIMTYPLFSVIYGKRSSSNTNHNTANLTILFLISTLLIKIWFLIKVWRGHMQTGKQTNQTESSEPFWIITRLVAHFSYLYFH